LIGLGAAGTLHPAAFGRCPRPAGIPPGPTDAGVKVGPPRRRRRRLGTAGRRTGGCGGSTLTPGRAGWSRWHGSGVPPSAQRHPPVEDAAALLTSVRDDPLRSRRRPVGTGLAAAW